MESDRPLARLGVIAALFGAGGWAIYLGSILLSYGWPAPALSAVLCAWSVLVALFAWPQLNQPDPARHSTLALILSISLAIGLAISYPLLTANDMGEGLRWIGVAAGVSAAIPLALLLWPHSLLPRNTSHGSGV